MNFTSKFLGSDGGSGDGYGKDSSSSSSAATTSYLKPKTDFNSDVTKALKRRLSEKMIRASTASYRSFRATVKEGQSAELSNVPRVFATKQTTIAKTHQVLNAMPKIMAEIDELYETLGQHSKATLVSPSKETFQDKPGSQSPLKPAAAQ